VTCFYAVPTFYARFLAKCRGASSIRHEAAPLRLGGRGAAARHWPTLAASAYGVDILDGLGSTRCCTLPQQPPRRRENTGTTASRCPAMPSASSRRREISPSEARWANCRSPGPLADHVLEQPRAVARHLPRRMDSLRRQIHRRRGGLLRLLRPPRRDMLKVGGIYVSPFESKAPCRATPTCSKPPPARGSPAGRGRPDQAEGLRVLSGGQSLDALRAGALQEHCKAKLAPINSALDRIPHRPAEDR